MVSVKMAFVLVQVGTNLWVNPTQVQGIKNTPVMRCETIILLNDNQCSDWPFDKVREALSPAAISKALGEK